MGEYTTFVESLPEDERVKRYTHWLTPLPCGRIGWRFRDKLFKPGDLYCEAGGPCVDWAKLPVETVNREDAEAFAAWLSREGRPRGARLCTDREWERAARGADDRTFPSANSPPGPADACSLITYGTRRAAPCAAGTHPASASPFGVLDMTGSVWEWVAGTPDVAAPTQACLRGGSWNSEGAVLSIPNRAVGDLGGKFPEKGLRICADLR